MFLYNISALNYWLINTFRCKFSKDKKGEVGTFKGLFDLRSYTTWEISLKTLGTFSIIKKLHHQKVGADIVITIIGVSYQFKWK